MSRPGKYQNGCRSMVSGGKFKLCSAEGGGGGVHELAFLFICIQFCSDQAKMSVAALKGGKFKQYNKGGETGFHVNLHAKNLTRIKATGCCPPPLAAANSSIYHHGQVKDPHPLDIGSPESHKEMSSISWLTNSALEYEPIC